MRARSSILMQEAVIWQSSLLTTWSKSLISQEDSTNNSAWLGSLKWKLVYLLEKSRTLAWMLMGRSCAFWLTNNHSHRFEFQTQNFTFTILIWITSWNFKSQTTEFLWRPSGTSMIKDFLQSRLSMWKISEIKVQLWTKQPPKVRSNQVLKTSS